MSGSLIYGIRDIARIGDIRSVRGNTAMQCIHEWEAQEAQDQNMGMCTGSGNNKIHEILYYKQ